jgi:hypothetical protein
MRVDTISVEGQGCLLPWCAASCWLSGDTTDDRPEPPRLQVKLTPHRRFHLELGAFLVDGAIPCDDRAYCRGLAAPLTLTEH